MCDTKILSNNNIGVKFYIYFLLFCSSSSNKMNPNSSDCNTEFSLSSTKKSDSTKKADLKERVSNTLNMRRHKKKQLATVKPIKGQLISE